MKVKIEVKSWNNYPPYTHTSGGGVAYSTYLAPKDNYSSKLFNGTTKYQTFILSPKINLFGLHKIAWCPWQPIGHCTGSFASRLKIDTCMLHILHRFFLSSTNTRKTSCQLLAKQKCR